MQMEAGTRRFVQEEKTDERREEKRERREEKGERRKEKRERREEKREEREERRKEKRTRKKTRKKRRKVVVGFTAIKAQNGKTAKPLISFSLQGIASLNDLGVGSHFCKQLPKRNELVAVC